MIVPKISTPVIRANYWTNKTHITEILSLERI